MVHRGGFSFLAMLVINPLVILFYQNCSIIPTSQAARSVASINDTKVDPSVPVKQAKLSCHEEKGHCPSSSIE